MASTVAEVIGAGARELRLDAGVTLEEMARAARSYGLPWTSGRVGDFEAGNTAHSLPTLIAAVSALSKAIGRPVTLAELITGKGGVQINDGLSVDRSALRGMLSGDDLGVHSVSLTTAAVGTAMEVVARNTSTAHWPKRLRAVKTDLRIKVLRDFSESDTRMCKNVGVDPFLGAAAMAALWHLPFTAERNDRTGTDANAQRRGQISRQLKAELQEVIRDGDD